MNTFYGTILLLAICCLSYVFGATDFDANANNAAGSAKASISSSELDALLNADGPSDNDVSNDNNGNNYDKRVERYSFGLGRRAYMYTNGGAGMKRLPVYNFGLGKRSDYDDVKPYELQDDSNFLDEKRNRPYSFGLGKRLPDATNRRLLPDEKRHQPYSFGLGKRMMDVHPRNRYDFGMGRR